MPAAAAPSDIETLPEEAPIVAPPPKRRRRWLRKVFTGFVAVCVAMGVWHSLKPLPRGVDVSGRITTTAEANITFLRDVTTADGFSQPVIRQQIFDEVFALIGNARDFVVVDFFLFNDQGGSLSPNNAPYRALSGELSNAIIARKRAQPALRVLLITDPINDVYGGEPSAALAALRQAGVDVVLTDLDRLRDSNPLYSSIWRTAIDWWAGDGSGEGWLPNPLESGPTRVTFRAWARLLNFKANHRKVVIGDNGAGGLVGIVSSANPHDASSAHSNVAIKITGEAIRPLLESEIEVARFSGWRGNLRPHEAADVRPTAPVVIGAPSAPAPTDQATVEVLTEGAIRRRIVERIDATRRGDAIDVAMFYMSERSIVEALLEAADRGVAVQVILDPNKDAFGRTKSGIPNRPMASELVAASDGAIKVRWYRTRGEQFHTKLLAVRLADRYWFTAGSANLTRRNIENFNLEANLGIETAADSTLARDVQGYFDLLWNNRDGADMEYTTDFATWADPKQSSYWLYRLMEASGLSTF
jgi:phosphatidylserine/phosphatidylglycerophosphate/cardiolipin synthase-like enzyme